MAIPLKTRHFKNNTPYLYTTLLFCRTVFAFWKTILGKILNTRICGEPLYYKPPPEFRKFGSVPSFAITWKRSTLRKPKNVFRFQIYFIFLVTLIVTYLVTVWHYFYLFYSFLRFYLFPVSCIIIMYYISNRIFCFKSLLLYSFSARLYNICTCVARTIQKSFGIKKFIFTLL